MTREQMIEHLKSRGWKPTRKNSSTLVRPDRPEVRYKVLKHVIRKERAHPDSPALWTGVRWARLTKCEVHDSGAIAGDWRSYYR